MNITNCIMNIKKSVIGMLLLLGGPSASWAQTDHRFEVMQNLDVFNSIYKQLDMLYVDTLDPKMTIGAGINAMLKSLDPYTEYYPAEKKSDFKMMVTGKYAGIGSLIRYNFALKNVVIEEPYANMPAAEAGLKKGDVILAIDNLSMEGKDNAYVSDHLRGDAGSTFIIKIRRPSTGKIMKLKITRRSEEHTSELQSRQYLVCRLLLEKNKNKTLTTSKDRSRRLSNCPPLCASREVFNSAWRVAGIISPAVI